jgi:outer membrane protein assembly factor BamB
VWTTANRGGGYGSVSIADGRIYGAGKRGDKEYVWALDEATGQEKWATPFADASKVSYGEGTRSTPTYSNGKVYAVAINGTLACLNAADGKVAWTKNYVKDFGGSVQAWGYSESVLVDDGKVIGTPCSPRAALVALKADTGAVVWEAKVERPGSAGGYSSPVKAEIGGVPMYLNLLGKSGGVVGVHAKTGRVLWQYAKIMNGTANIPSPVVKGNHVFASTGYRDGGAALLELTESGGAVSVKELQYYASDELQNHHGGMVPVGDHLYFGNRHNSGLPACVELATGEIKWKESQGAGGGGGSGTVIAADGMLYFRYENGVVALVKASPEKFEPVSSFTIPQASGKPSWPHLALANGKLYIRDQEKLHCFDVKAK